MFFSEGNESRDTSNNQRWRAYPAAADSLLPSTFSAPGRSNSFFLNGTYPFSTLFWGGAFYPGKDKKRHHRRTVWYRLFCSTPWRKGVSFLITVYFLLVFIFKPFATSIAGYGSLIASSRRRKGMHGTWLLYDESLLSSIRTVEEERAEALRLTNEQKRLQLDTYRNQKILERIIPGWYHRNDFDADKNKVVKEKLKEAERLIEEREGAVERHTSNGKPNQEAVNGVEAPVGQRRLANFSSEIVDGGVRTIHNMEAFRNRSSCLSTLPADDIRITLVLQSTPERLWILRRTCQSWTDPIVLVVFSDSEEAQASTKEIGECPQLQIIHHRTNLRLGEDGQEQYPVNRLRNLGLDAVQTSHVMIADIDFVPSQGLPDQIRATLVERNKWRSQPLSISDILPSENTDAIVVPAFERIPPSELCSGSDCIPESKEDLMKLSLPSSFDELRSCVLEKKECRIFQIHNNRDGHSSTRSDAWLDKKWYKDGEDEGKHGVKHNVTENAARIRTLHCFDSVRYEPYVVVRWCPSSIDKRGGPVAPYYDERFHGYGKNKIEMISHLRIMGYSFSVLPEGFIIHAPHSISRAKKAWESTKDSSLHKNMDELYPQFLKELVDKYKHENRKVLKQC